MIFSWITFEGGYPAVWASRVNPQIGGMVSTSILMMHLDALVLVFTITNKEQGQQITVFFSLSVGIGCYI